MSVTPAGLVSAPVYALRTMLAACAAFQELVGVEKVDEALAKIIAFGQVGDAARPYAVVNLGTVNSRTQSLATSVPDGDLSVYLEAEVADLDDEGWSEPSTTAEVLTTWANVLGAIHDQLRAQVGAGTLLLRDVTISNFGRNDPKNQDGDFVGATLRITFGITGGAG